MPLDNSMRLCTGSEQSFYKTKGTPMSKDGISEISMQTLIEKLMSLNDELATNTKMTKIQKIAKMQTIINYAEIIRDTWQNNRS